MYWFALTMSIEILLWIVGILITIVVGWYFSSKRKPSRRTILKLHKKKILDEGRCPNCGNKDIIINSIPDYDSDGNVVGGWDNFECKKCQNTWNGDYEH